jgi:hypothetical protein
MTDRPLTNRQWPAKLVAAIVPGIIFSFGCMAVVGLLCHTTGETRTVSSQFLMWLAVLVWLGVMGSCFLFRSGLRAWIVLGGAAILVWALFEILAKVTTA